MTLSNKIDIRDLSIDDLHKQFEEFGFERYRVNQVYEWIWKKSVVSFDEMTNVSVAQRDLLKEKYHFHTLNIENLQTSIDGTRKVVFSLFDNKQIEGVLIPARKRVTACISSQVGCKLKCKFCATGYMKTYRNLSAGEIYDQVVILNSKSQELFNQNLTNIVFMGMGEPLLNFKNVLSAIDKLTSEKGLGISLQRITLSTAGIVKMIKKLADTGLRVNLAISLHSANYLKRAIMMPVCQNNDLEALKEAIIYFYKKTNTRITYEYLMIENFNDSISDAKELANFCKITPCKVNLIEYNPNEFVTYQPPDITKINAFKEYLEGKNMVVNLRISRGKDIDAACGQLVNKNLKEGL